jgi:hypothetical protein
MGFRYRFPSGDTKEIPTVDSGIEYASEEAWRQDNPLAAYPWWNGEQLQPPHIKTGAEYQAEVLPPQIPVQQLPVGMPSPPVSPVRNPFTNRAFGLPQGANQSALSAALRGMAPAAEGV